MCACRLIAALQHGKTSLHLACEHGHVDVAELLIARGADMLAKEDLVSRRRGRRRGRVSSWCAVALQAMPCVNVKSVPRACEEVA